MNSKSKRRYFEFGSSSSAIIRTSGLFVKPKPIVWSGENRADQFRANSEQYKGFRIIWTPVQVEIEKPFNYRD